MKKGFISIVLCLAVVFSFIALPVHAATSGKCGKDVTWSLDSDTLTISGTGYMWDFEYYTSPWSSSAGSITKVEIQSGVTSIGNYAFCDCDNLTSITIPNSVTSIGYDAFCGCFSLTNITIPNSVTSIGDNAFYRCSHLTSVVIPNSVKSIGAYAFYWCSSLTSVVIPNSIESIGDFAFANSGLTNVTIPNSVTNIGKRVFSCCCCLTSIDVDIDSINYSSNNGVLLNKSQTELIFCPCAKSGVYTIPNSVTSIDDYAFYGCEYLTSIIIPNSVKSIGANAFEFCVALASISIPNSVTSIGEWAFYECYDLTNITIPSSVTSIESHTFRACGLKNITIPNSVTNIGDYAFEWCSDLTSVTIGNGVKCIGDYAFSECYGLTDITIPNSVSSIGEGAFDCCDELENVKYYGTAEDWENISIGIGNECLLESNIIFIGKFNVEISDTDAYKDITTGGLRFITDVNRSTDSEIEYYGTWFLPNSLYLDGLTDLQAEVKTEGDLKGNQYTADLLNIPSDYYDTLFIGISFVKFKGVDNLVLGTKVTSVNGLDIEDNYLFAIGDKTYVKSINYADLFSN